MVKRHLVACLVDSEEAKVAILSHLKMSATVS